MGKEDEVLKLREEVGKLQQQKRDQAEPSSTTSDSTGSGSGSGSGSSTTIASPTKDEQQEIVKPVEDQVELGEGYDGVLPPKNLPSTSKSSESGSSGTNHSKHDEPKAEDTCDAGLFKLRLAHQLTMKLLKQKL